MAARYVEQFTVRTPDELNELEEAIGDGQLEAVVVDVPDGSSAFQTAREFRHLLTVARAAGVELEISTDDPLRRELARILGLRLSSDTVLDSPVVDAPALPDPSSSKTFRIVRPDAPVTIDVTADETDWNAAETRPAFKPWQRPEEIDADPDDDDEVDDGSYSFVIHPPTTRRTATQSDDRPARPTETIPSFEVWEANGYRDPISQLARSRVRRLRPFAWLSLLLTIALVGALLMMFLLPAATIAVVPVESQVNEQLTYGVALPGTNWDIAIQPETINSTLTFSATIPTTGERFEPDAAARGAVLLTNASTVEVLVPAGTIVSSEAGLQFTTVADVVVPAADPYGSLTIGSATIEVAATAPGPDSNVVAETVFGQLDSGIYYLNRDPIGGGTLRRIATVSQADIDTLNNRAKQDLDSKAIGAIDARLTDGQQLLTDTEERGQIQSTLSHSVGADATSLKLDASLMLSAQAYSLDDIHERAEAAVTERLRATAGDDVTILRDTLRTSEPQPVAGSEGAAFTVDASATVRSNISQADLDAIRAELSGEDAEAATARIRQVPGVAEVEIDHSPNWLGGRMPRLASRIQIEVIDATGVQAQTTSTRP
ncbi:MAG TPA: baseplate J/gp47 family protein [Thermomicrobiales bacterium]|nr:baseplate J/gp47 family protein [Thermomicrobiales bacterium]